MKMTQQFTEGRHSSVTQFVTDGKSSIRNVLFSKICPELSEQYALKAGPRDEVVELMSFSCRDRASFAFSVVIASYVDADAMPGGHTLEVIRFKKWIVCVYYGLCTLPSRDFGSMHVLNSTPLRVNGVPVNDDEPTVITAKSNDDLVTDIIGGESNCAFRLRFAIAQKMIEPLRSAFLAQEVYFHTNPMALLRRRMQRGDIIFQ